MIVGKAIRQLPTPTRDGYTFDGWYTDKTGGIRISSATLAPNKSTVYYAHWIKQVTVLFDANGGTKGYRMLATPGIKLGTLPIPTRNGYTFDGWYTARTGGYIITANTLTPSKSVVYYAHWKIIPVVKYNIKFYAYDGNYTTKTINQGNSLGDLPTPTRSGYTFLGWYTTVSGGTQINKNTVPPGSRTYYAHWSVKKQTQSTTPTIPSNFITYKSSTDWATSTGILIGNGSSLNLYGNLIRADALVILHRLAGQPSYSGSTGFSDVSSNAYYAKAVIWANKKGIVKGTGSGSFSPYNTCTRGAFVTFLHRYARSPYAYVSKKYSSISDFNQPTNWALSKGLITQTMANNIDRTITRKEAIDILYAYYQKFM